MKSLIKWSEPGYYPNDSDILHDTCRKLNLEVEDCDFDTGPYRWYRVEIPEHNFKGKYILNIPKGMEGEIPDFIKEEYPYKIRVYDPETENPYKRGLYHNYSRDAVPFVELVVEVKDSKEVSFLKEVFTEKWVQTGWGYTCALTKFIDIES